MVQHSSVLSREIKKLEMRSLQTGEGVSVTLAIANTDDSSVRDIRIHTSGLHMNKTDNNSRKTSMLPLK